MSTTSSTIVQRVWNYCNVLRDDGVSYGDYLCHQSITFDSAHAQEWQALLNWLGSLAAQ